MVGYGQVGIQGAGFFIRGFANGMIVLDLPFPTSTNRHRKGRAKLSEEYLAWRRNAKNFYLAQKRRCVPVKGHFRADIIVSSEKRRSNADVDNRIKSVLDLLQAVELIENDCLADRVSIEWGKPEDAPEGCRVFVFPTEQKEAA